MGESNRFSAQHVNQWREEGFAIIPDFFTEAEIRPIHDDYERIYGLKPRGQYAGDDSELSAEARKAQFKNIDIFPYEGSVEMNFLSLHPALIAFAKALLGVDDVHLYQSHTWAKYTGETNYDQDFHCDFANHTLLIPADDVALRTVDFIVYLTDVTDAHGALHYVTKPDSDELLRAGAVGIKEEQQALLKARQKSAAGSAGTLVAHGIDTFHRGTNLTAENGYRFTMTIGYKAAGNDMVGYSVWQDSGDRPWQTIFDHATAEQLACLGIPRPGHPYWTRRTLGLCQARWPNWDMTAYRQK